MEELDRKCALLPGNLRIGPDQPDIEACLRCFPVGDYLIFYRLLSDGIEAVRIAHSSLRPAEPL